MFKHLYKIAQYISTMRIPRDKLNNHKWMLANLRKLNPTHKNIDKVEDSLRCVLQIKKEQ